MIEIKGSYYKRLKETAARYAKNGEHEKAYGMYRAVFELEEFMAESKKGTDCTLALLSQMREKCKKGGGV